jgi:hypothetical protein
MVGMGSDEDNLMDYFKKKVVTVSMSYEYDPTDVLKIPQLLAEANNEVYVKEKNEDFMTLLSGVMGQKKLHIQIGDVLDTEIDKIKEECSNSNKQIQALAQVIDASIIKKLLWPTNYIAYDILNKTKVYSHLYTADENRFWTQIRDAYRC